MVWIITVIGVIALFIFQYRMFCIENKKPKDTKKSNVGTQQKNKIKGNVATQEDNAKIKSFFGFLMSVNFLKTIIELLVIILGATIAISFTQITEKKQARERMASLLKLAEAQITTSYAKNNFFLKRYDEDKGSIGELKYNSSCETSFIEYILENNEALITLTPFTISVLYSNNTNAKNFYETVNKADEKDENVKIYVQSINSHLNLMDEAIKAEIDYLEGRSSEEEIQKYYNDIIFSKFKIIPEEDLANTGTTEEDTANTGTTEEDTADKK